ncbi:MAG: hypothetical protein LBU32_25865 [Clostridiales bacterium]|jgi:competence protein ComGC|nr:hypothetical protein [Clostridiales bacterium]
MMRDWDLALVSRMIFILVLGIVIGFIFFNVIQSSDEKNKKQAERMEEIIKKAAIQCYALEGSYPADIYYLERYGVLFDDNGYYYRYSTNFIGNYMPEVDVVAK